MHDRAVVPLYSTVDYIGHKKALTTVHITLNTDVRRQICDQCAAALSLEINNDQGLPYRKHTCFMPA